MDNLYLITRLDDIRGAFVALVVLAGIASVIFMIAYFSNKGQLEGRTEEDINTYHKGNVYWCRIGKKGTIWSLITFFVSMIVLCVIPTTKQGLLLYGVNETIEFCEKHPETKQIPDKCIKALNKYLDEELKTDETYN
jgi:hypothetical protein